MSLNVLYIDAWSSDEFWTWNNWHKIDEVSVEDFEKCNSDEDYLSLFIDMGLVDDTTKHMLSIEDDGYNIVLQVVAENYRPLYAIEYGPMYN